MKIEQESYNKLEQNALKSLSFLNFMVKAVFLSTFIFTAIVGYFAWAKGWEQLIIVLTEKWFNIMVSELIVMGFIQVIKEIFQSIVRKSEIELENKMKEDNISKEWEGV